MKNVLVGLTFLMGFAGIVRGGESDSIRVESPFFVTLGDTVMIVFDLIAPGDALVDVVVTLRKQSDTTFSLSPTSLTGAVGRVRGGGRKAIFWDYKRDVSDSFPYSQDYWFEINAATVEEGFKPAWWHYTIGGAGIVALALLLSSGGENPAETPPATGLPDPPGIRPPGK
jgi:hypothetical protein